MRDLKLEINKNKSKCMICERPTKRNILTEVKLGNYILEIVENYKYLGFLINSQLLDSLDIKQRHCDFNCRFNSVFRNFKHVSVETFLFLFNSYCLPDYGLNLWDFKSIFNKQPFKCFDTGFSNALKKIVGAPIHASSHITAEKCSHMLLKHYVSCVQSRYMKRVFSLKEHIIRLSSPYLKKGHLYTSYTKWLQNNYEIDVWEYDLETINARILWVQRHEERRGICPFYGR